MARFWCLLMVTLLAACASGGDQTPPSEPPDTELANAAQTAQLAYARGLYQLAANQYAQALKRARAMDDAKAIGTQAYNRALALIALGELEQAEDLLEESETELGRAGLPLADVFLVQARLLHHQALQGDMQASTELDAAAQRVLDDPRSHPSASHRAQVALLRAEVDCDRNNAAVASQQLAQARSLAGTEPEDSLRAGLARATGCLSLLQRDPAGAGRHFDEEAELMRRNRRYRDMAKALHRSASAYRQGGLNALAADRFYRAARSWLGQGEREKAKADIEAAATVVAAIDDRRLRELIQVLREEIERG